MSEVKGEPTDNELSEVDAKLLSPGWINLLDGAGLSYRERQVIGWALRVAPRLRRDAANRTPKDIATVTAALAEMLDEIEAADTSRTVVVTVRRDGK